MKFKRTTCLVFGCAFLSCAVVGSTACSAYDEFRSDKNTMKYAIVIHGGAGRSPADFDAETNAQRRAALKSALGKGTEILKTGGSSLDAVEAVIRILEDDPQFNAGKGAVFNAAGSHELDASIMDGKSLNCGAVAGVSIVKNPISCARKVMTETRHVLLAGPGAESFAKQQQLDLVEPTYFDTPGEKESWEEYKSRKSKSGGMQFDSQFTPRWSIGTVGCVALDSHGNLAAGTSTGGMTDKKYGRVGDSPIVGAGTYADNQTCAVSGTGIGEQYIRHAVAYDVAAQMKYKNSTLEQAVNDNLENRLDQGDGGLIAVDKDGNVAFGFNTTGMAVAVADSTGKFEVIWDDQ